MKKVMIAVFVLALLPSFFCCADSLDLAEDLQALQAQLEQLNTALNKLVPDGPTPTPTPKEEELKLPEIPADDLLLGYEEEEELSNEWKQEIKEDIDQGWESDEKEIPEEEKTDDDIPKTITEAVKAGLEKIWKAFSWEEVKKLYKEKYSIQYLGTQARVTKGVKVNAAGYLDPVGTNEGQFVSQRIISAQQALQNFTGLKFRSKDEVPRIGCAFSGGGYRAMIATSGFLKAFEDLGILDAVLNISTLSGSVWYLGPWTFYQDPVNNKKVTVSEYQQILIEKIKNKQFDILPKDRKNIKFDVKSFIEKVVWPKVVFEQVISSIDIYGGALAYVLLSGFGDGRFSQRLSNQWFNVKEGNHPWPSYTSASMHNIAPEGKRAQYTYNWYEFDPVEARNLEQNVAIPSFAFGRTFENSLSTNFAPEQSFGFIMGICGSAYTVNLNDIIKIYFGYDPKKEGYLSKENLQTIGDWNDETVTSVKSAASKMKTAFSLTIKGKFKDAWNEVKDYLNPIKGIILEMLLNWIADIKIEKEIKVKGIEVGKISTTLGVVRVSPTQIANPFKGYAGIDQPWLKDKEYLTFVDAGIDYNIPLRPLLRPERDLDLIIIGDVSTTVGLSLPLALQDIERVYGVTYTKDEKNSSKIMYIYRANEKTYPKADKVFKNMVPPDIIYFSFLKDDMQIVDAEKRNDQALIKVINDNNLKTFDPEKCLKDFCGTFNFSYTEQQFKQLSGMAEFNVKAHKSLLKAMIEERVELRQKAPAEWGR